MRACDTERSFASVHGTASHASACAAAPASFAGTLQPSARSVSTLMPAQFIIECRYGSWWRQNCA